MGQWLISHFSAANGFKIAARIDITSDLLSILNCGVFSLIKGIKSDQTIIIVSIIIIIIVINIIINYSSCCHHWRNTLKLSFTALGRYQITVLWHLCSLQSKRRFEGSELPL